MRAPWILAGLLLAGCGSAPRTPETFSPREAAEGFDGACALVESVAQELGWAYDGSGKAQGFVKVRPLPRQPGVLLVFTQVLKDGELFLLPSCPGDPALGEAEAQAAALNAQSALETFQARLERHLAPGAGEH